MRLAEELLRLRPPHRNSRSLMARLREWCVNARVGINARVVSERFGCDTAFASTYLRRLGAEGLLVPAGKLRQTGGQPLRLWKLNPRRH